MRKLDYTIPLDEAEQKYDDCLIRALERVDSLGLGIPPRPTLGDGSTYYDGYLPSNLNDFTNAQLGEIHVLQCRYADWVHGILVSAKAEADNAEQKLKQTKAQVRKTKQGTAQERDDQTITDVRYVDVETAYYEAKHFAKLVEVRAEAASRDLRVISRLVTGKEIEVSMNRRDLNIGRKDGRKNHFI